MVLSVFAPWPSGVFFTGAATAPSELVPAMFPVAIAGRPYNIEPKLYRMTHVPVQREARTDEAEPGEATLSPKGLWRRSQSDWSLGQGQIWLDEQESTRRRFRASLGCDVFNDRKVSLLPRTEEKRNSTNTNLRFQEVGARLYVVDGATLIFSNGSGSEQNATWVTGWTTATGLPGGNILDIAYSGSHVYVLGSDNSIYRATPGTTAFTLFYNPTAVATRIWFGLGRLFMGDGRTLYEVTATPGETQIFQHPSPNYVLSHVCAAPTGIYISGNIGDFGEMRHSWVNDAGTAFVAPVVVAELDNEPINVTRSVGNNIILGTNVGFRYAPIDGLTTGLDFGAAVEIGAVRDMTVETVISPDGKLDTFVWATWNLINGGAESGLAKIRLTRFTEPNVPAYASDIYSSAGGTVLCVASVANRRYFGVSTDGFFGPTSTLELVPSGTLSTGRIRYGILDDKLFTDTKWRTEPLNGVVEATVTFDHGGSVPGGSQTIEGTVSNEHFSIGPTASEWAEITFTLTRDTSPITQGPVFRWWVLRAIPTPESTMQILCPLRLTDKEQTPLGPAKTVAFLDEIDFLMGLVASKQLVIYQEGIRGYQVYLENIELAPTRWNTMEQGLEGICMVEMYSAVHP